LSEIYSDVKAFGAAQHWQASNTGGPIFPDEEVSGGFRAARCGGLAIQSATHSGVIPVAYRCQRPVIATSVGALPEVVQEGRTGWLTPPEDPSALANAIRRFFVDLNQPDLSAGLAEACHSLSWETYASRLEEFIVSLGGI
jgi:glycosyltransferase involved in cell wall biosynthesis